MLLPQIDHTDECALMCGKCIAVLNEFHDMYSLVNTFSSFPDTQLRARI